MIHSTSWGRSLCVALLACLLAGCQGGPRQRYLQQSQLRNMQLFQQNRALMSQRDAFSQSTGGLAAERDRLAQQNQALKQNLDLANQRLANIQNSNNNLEQRMQNLLAGQHGPSPLSSNATQRLEELKQKYPEFEFDPQTGVSKFHSDLLFSSGSDELHPEGKALLADFARIMNQSDAKHLNILVVGHTDDKPISKATTRNRHPTNWHLSTNRANSVIGSLKFSGIEEARMGAAGYSMFQPVVANSDEKARSKNRRVEIFVLAPDAVVAGWEPQRR